MCIRDRNKSGLTEPAAANAAAEQLNYGPVVNRFQKRYYKTVRKENAVQIFHNPLMYHRRRAVPGCYCPNGTILLIGHFVQRRNIYPFDFAGTAQILLTAPALSLIHISVCTGFSAQSGCFFP